MEKEVIIKQDLTENSLAKASLYILYSSKLKIFGLIFLGVTLLNITLLVLIDGWESVTFTPLFVVIALIAIIVFSVIYSSKKSFKKNPRYYTDVIFTINEAEFKFEGKGFQNTHKWEDLVKVKSSKKWHLVYINHTQAVIIDRLLLDPWQEDGLNGIFNSIRSKIKVVK